VYRELQSTDKENVLSDFMGNVQKIKRDYIDTRGIFR